MMKKILLINGNPKSESLSSLLSDTYEIEARENAAVQRFNLEEMNFNPSLDCGYDGVLKLEPCLSDLKDALLWANHIVIVSPIWWGGLPGKLKGLIDRVFLPGVTFKFEGDSPVPSQFLQGKTARIILTMDAPSGMLEEQSRSVLEQLDRFTLQYCGVEKAEYNLLGPVISAQEEQLSSWIRAIKELGSDCR
ncbi:NAD(P)H-dependent oxidoreductase [Microbulbifer sp. OS29]|uniref:NAD(P)H-dependent oxidoreductase n=1 Tax=Microbulbifer okhotskensis TaxID=2926617 RepID=A0A9X2EQL1_9GAMM|nr:NAD(P)H-dependent oxidoreductase [Microbulbifer okhotskensis]MCO1335525.1 NAD(P)H-dependent oxidoreductase [Microbulbifer okhotskensis]